MGEGKGLPGRPRRKHYNHSCVRNELRDLIPAEVTRMQVLNLIERACGYWFEAAGGDHEEFEEWFNNNSTTR